MVNQDEVDLINKCKRGDTWAFKQIYETYHKKVYHIAYGFTRNREEALDIVQEVFIKLFNSLKNFRGESNLYTYVYRMAINTSIDHTRKTQRFRTSSLDLELPFQLADLSEKRPDNILFGKEVEKKIGEALSELPEDQKTTIILREIEGLSYEEISKLMGCSIGTVMSRLHYGRKRMKEALKEYMMEIK